MISQLMKYGGVSAKVRSMYGKRLKRADFDNMIRMTSISDIALYLKDLPGWQETLRDINPYDVSRHDLESALNQAVIIEYTRIFKFISASDHPLMRYLIMRKEMEEILSLLRLLTSDNGSEYRCLLPPFIRDKSPINFNLFAQCGSFDDLLNLLTRTRFHRALTKLPRPPGSPPDYTTIKTVLLSEYINSIYETINKNYSKDIATTLDKGFSLQSELLNIETIIRIKSTYPELSEYIPSLLLPKYHFLRPALLHSLIQADSVDTALQILKASPYSKLYTSYDYAHIEDYRYRYLYDFYKRLLSDPMPSVCAPIAYIYLKEHEIKTLINVIECVHYGTTPDEVSLELVVG